jgi:hypothetical protein
VGSIYLQRSTGSKWKLSLFSPFQLARRDWFSIVCAVFCAWSFNSGDCRQKTGVYLATKTGTHSTKYARNYKYSGELLSNLIHCLYSNHHTTSLDWLPPFLNCFPLANSFGLSLLVSHPAFASSPPRATAHA